MDRGQFRLEGGSQNPGNVLLVLVFSYWSVRDMSAWPTDLRLFKRTVPESLAQIALELGMGEGRASAL